MRCGKVRRLLSAHMDGELSERDEALVAAHLRVCRGCAELRGSLEKMVSALSGLPELEPPPRLPELVLRRLAEEKARSVLSGAWVRWVAVPALGTAAAAVALALILASLRPARHGEITARRDKTTEAYRSLTTEKFREGKGIAPSGPEDTSVLRVPTAPAERPEASVGELRAGLPSREVKEAPAGAEAAGARETERAPSGPLETDLAAAAAKEEALGQAVSVFAARAETPQARSPAAALPEAGRALELAYTIREKPAPSSVFVVKGTDPVAAQRAFLLDLDTLNIPYVIEKEEPDRHSLTLWVERAALDRFLLLVRQQEGAGAKAGKDLASNLQAFDERLGQLAAPSKLSLAVVEFVGPEKAGPAPRD